MEYIIITMFGIFVGITTASYMFINELNKRGRKIDNQKAMINNRDDLIDYQCKKLQGIKSIIVSEVLYINKIDKIMELVNDSQAITNSKKIHI